MNLADSLERRATRGPQRDPTEVIAEARRSIGRSTANDGGTELAMVALVDRPDGEARSPRRHAVARLALVAAVVLVVLAAIATRRHGRVVAIEPADGPPSLPVAISDVDRAAAVARCAGAAGVPAGTDIVDARPEGVLVGSVSGDVWQTCVYPSTSKLTGWAKGQGNVLVPPTPPSASPARPIVVVDAKSPDGNMVDGNEVTFVWGRIDPSIARVVVSAPSGSYVATIENGLFAAWWPGNDGDRTVVHALDVDGNEVAFADQLNCGGIGPPGQGITPRLVVAGAYVEGGCIGGHDVPAGTGGDDIPDPPKSGR